VYINRINDRPYRFNGKKYDLQTVIKYLRSEVPFFPDSDFENNVAVLDRVFWLANEEFIRTDKLTMNFGMEGRFPFLDREVISMAYSLPSERKMKDGRLKYLLKDSYKNELPDYIINKRKTGWTAPVVEWMEKPLFISFIKEVASPSFYKEINPLCQSLLDNNFKEKKGPWSTAHLKKVMPIISFKIWAKSLDIRLS
jgi:asparagine synthase (glutamine-hydrolysing)